MSDASSFFAKYRTAIEQHHGWQVELSCPDCGHEGLPVYAGWNPKSSMNFNKTPTVFAQLSCTECGRNLEDVAGNKLVKLFADRKVPSENRKILFVFFLGGLALLAALFIPGIVTGTSFLYILPALALSFIMPSMMFINYKISSIRNRCECGKPDYLLMGLLGRAYCYRCSNCGRLLKLRD